MPIRRYGLLLVALFAPACASTPHDDDQPGAQVPAIHISGTDALIILDGAPDRLRYLILAPADSAWPALLGAYEEIGIEIGFADPGGLAVGNRQLQLQRRLGGTRLSRYFNCGTSITGSVANESRIEADLTTRLVAVAADTTRLETSISAIGYSLSGSSNSAVRCSSRGRLEERIAEAVAARIPE